MRISDRNCQVCLDTIFSKGTTEAESGKGNIIPKCGHPIHFECFKSLQEHNKNKCSSCKSRDWRQVNANEYTGVFSIAIGSVQVIRLAHIKHLIAQSKTNPRDEANITFSIKEKFGVVQNRVAIQAT